MDTTERITVAVAALVLTHSAAMYFRVGPIEQDLEVQVRAALANRGLGAVEVTATGRDLTLHGTVPDHRAAARALAIAEGTTGVRVVHHAMTTDS